ncbi:Basic amino-acid permease [Orbilia oligospora]|uniref:Basic amino-acid permease n=1 Tax=Orbilia oligospora TaxID=2813651 RepID=A0A7C8JDQ3_ORBOL|nr:Basic amino-acid permease [Orbilia oligospora]KAF3113823.1 Basic amino-acid permease [Orbilia oligospora]KAF3115931.1 Basic amino-acid permease [Orbilia oligospora]KAF3138245.1 Basic amino-acid permease [Orbilia oligospora]KAF3149628.1 Basic amino-acid permease [Orbilia oligospora]
MKFLTASLLIGSLLPLISAAPTPQSPSTGSSSDKKFIVVLKDTVNTNQLKKHTQWAARIHARNLQKRQLNGLPVERHISGVEKTFDINRFKAYSGSFDDDTLREIKENDDVAYVEPEQDAYTSEIITQSEATWGISELSNQASNTSTYYYDSSAGEGMYAYIIDSGINFSHDEFEGRAELGYNALKHLNNTDTSGHGTHVSGTVAGKTYGVAKKANLVNVKVFQGRKTSTINIFDGFNWAVQDILEKNRTNVAVINMSLTTKTSKAFNAMVDSAYEKGILSVVAAGNKNVSASLYSPASANTSIAVGAVSRGHVRGSYSNWGPSVNLFAPGTGITSAGIANDTAVRVLTGTSMASPHVAGLICYLRAAEGLTNAKDVVDRMLGLAQQGVLNETTLNESPNLLASNGVELNSYYEEPVGGDYYYY